MRFSAKNAGHFRPHLISFYTNPTKVLFSFLIKKIIPRFFLSSEDTNNFAKADKLSEDYCSKSKILLLERKNRGIIFFIKKEKSTFVGFV